MLGYPFGAPHHLRLSYGNLPPDEAMEAVSCLDKGLDHILTLAATRCQDTVGNQSADVVHISSCYPQPPLL